MQTVQKDDLIEALKSVKMWNKTTREKKKKKQWAHNYEVEIFSTDGSLDGWGKLKDWTILVHPTKHSR